MRCFYLSCNAQMVVSKIYFKKVFFAAVLLLLINTSTLAQVLWTDAGSATNWSGSANWTPNTAYTSWLTTDIAKFNNTGTAITAGIDMSLGSLSIGAIQTSRSRDLTIGNSSATAGTLTLNGTTIAGTSNVIITSASSNNSTLYINDNETGSGKTMNLALGSSYNVIKPGASASIEIGCSISGTGELAVVGGGSSGFYEVTLAGANTYTGLTTVAVKMGQLVLRRPGGGTLPATNDVFISDGTLRINTNQTLHNVTILSTPGCQIRVANGATLTITGTLTDAAAVGVVLEGTGKIVYAPGATLKYSGGNALNTSSVEFPTISGPTNLTISGTAPAINLHQARTITGTLTLEGASDIIKLGANDLTVGSIAATAGSMVVTDGIGFLIVSNIGTSPVTFPVGAAAGSHNHVTIAKGGGLPYGARVKIGIDGPLNLTSIYETVNRLWILYRPSVSPSPVDISFGYSNTDGNPGFDYTAPVALSHYNGNGWSTVQSNVPPVQPVTFSTTPTIPSANIAFVIANSSSPMGTQKLWANSGTATDWYGATNWAPNTNAASWLTDDYAKFNNTGSAITAGIDMSQGSLSLGAIVIGSRTRNLTIGNSSTTNGTLTLRGISIDGHNDVIIYQAPGNSGTTTTIQDNETGTGKHMDIVLSNPGYSRIFAMSNLEIKSAITGPDKKLVFDGWFQGNVILTGANSYSGHTLLTANGVKVTLARPGGSTFTNDTNDITVGSILEILTNQTLRNVLVKKNGFLTVGDGATLTITGTLTDNNTDLNHIICIGTGKIVYAPAANLVYNSGIPLTTSSAELPITNGPAKIEVGAGTSVTLHESRTINGPLELSGGTLAIGANSLTCNNVTATSGSVITNGTGRLIVKNVGVAPVSFPVTTGGITNTVTIANGQGLDYGVGVVEGISPAIVNNNNAVNRTWYIKPSATPAQPVNVSFAYSNGDGNAGFNYSAPVEVAQYSGAWNVLQSNITQVQPLPVTLITLTGNADNAFIISNAGAVLASESTLDFNVVKQQDKGHLTWKIENTADLKQLEIERSANGRDFIALGTVATSSIYFDDNQLLPATNYYRLKMTNTNGKIAYSTIVALLNAATGFDMVSIVPTIVTSSAVLNITTAQKTKIDVLISDVSGKKLQHTNYTLRSGSNQLVLNLASLSAGVYIITGYNEQGISKMIRFVKQ